MYPLCALTEQEETGTKPVQAHMLCAGSVPLPKGSQYPQDLEYKPEDR